MIPAGFRGGLWDMATGAALCGVSAKLVPENTWATHLLNSVLTASCVGMPTLTAMVALLVVVYSYVNRSEHHFPDALDFGPDLAPYIAEMLVNNRDGMSTAQIDAWLVRECKFKGTVDRVGAVLTPATEMPPRHRLWTLVA